MDTENVASVVKQIMNKAVVMNYHRNNSQKIGSINPEANAWSYH